MQPIGMKRFASTHQVGTALVAGLLISSALWVAVLGLTGHVTPPRRQHAPAAQAIVPVGSSSAERFFQAKLDELDELAGRQSVGSAHAPSANVDRADYLARLGTTQQRRSTNPTDRGARMGGASAFGTSPTLGADDSARRMGGPHGARFTER